MSESESILPVTEVAAAVILRTINGQKEYLLAQRPMGKACAGYWEFPGGKVEPGERFAAALVRELQEELGITAQAYTPWLTREFVYPHARVRIRFFRVTAWSGTLRPLEHSDMAWLPVDCAEAPVSPILPANTPILRALSLPETYCITQADVQGLDVTRARLQQVRPLLVQVRHRTGDHQKDDEFSRQIIATVQGYGGRAVLNGTPQAAQALGADGVHLTAKALMACTQRPQLPWVFASCHNQTELAQAAALALDAVVLGPVARTLTHPEQAPLGWAPFAEWIESTTLPVYALGGLSPADKAQAQCVGAQGVALMRGW